MAEILIENGIVSHASDLGHGDWVIVVHEGGNTAAVQILTVEMLHKSREVRVNYRHVSGSATTVHEIVVPFLRRFQTLRFKLAH